MSGPCPKCGWTDEFRVYHGPLGYGFCRRCNIMCRWDGSAWHEFTPRNHRERAAAKKLARGVP